MKTMDSSESEEDQPLIRKDVITKKADKPLTVFSKLSYGIGGVPFMSTVGVLVSYIPYFLLEIAKIQPFYSSVVLFGGGALESLANPVVGVSINKFDSRFGKMKPWIVCSLPFLMLSYFCTWIVPDIDEVSKFAYYLSMYGTFLISLTCYNLPHLSLIMYLSTDQHERDSATAYRLVSSLTGSVIANLIVSAFLDAGDNGSSSADPCVVTNQSTNQSVISNTTSDAAHQMEMAFLSAGGTVVCIMLVCGLILIFGTTEKKDISIGKSGDDNVWKSMKSVLSFRPYYIALPAFLIPLVNMQVMFSNMTLYLVYALKLDSFYYGIIILQASDVLYMPVWQKISTKAGKMRTFVMGLLILIPLLVVLFFLPENNIVVAFIFCHLIGATLACCHLMPWSLLPDVIDDYIVRTGLRNDALFYSFFQCFMKIANAIGMGLSTFVLAFSGFETGACKQRDSVGLTVRLLLSAVPICIILVSLIFLWWFPITDARTEENNDILAKQRAYRQRHRSSSIYC